MLFIYSVSELIIILAMIFVPIISVVSYVYYAEYHKEKFSKCDKSYRIRKIGVKNHGKEKQKD